MSFFDWLLIAHLVGDFLLQTEFQAVNKAKGRFFNGAIIAHCATYTICFIPVLMFLGAPLWWLAWVFGTHVVLDRRWPVVLWRRCIKRDSALGIEQTAWLTIALDQTFHLCVLAVIAGASAPFRP